MNVFERIEKSVRGKGVRIVFPEPTDVRILRAAVRLQYDQIIEPVLVGDKEETNTLAKELDLDIANLELIDPADYPEDKKEAMIKEFVERRKGKATPEQAREAIKDPMYFGTMLVQLDIADGLVAGAATSTGDVVRPALQIIKTAPGSSIMSGCFVMVPPSEEARTLVFADCAININPTAEQLADIAQQTVRTGKIFGVDPKVAMLSFSTKGSASSPEVDKVVEATRILKETSPDLDVDGELQFDAAYSPVVARQKVSDSTVAGEATIFVFPDLEAGNIGYKIAQRLGSYDAVGPILQGMAKPVCDLSRGCDEDDIYRVAMITALDALKD